MTAPSFFGANPVPLGKGMIEQAVQSAGGCGAVSPDGGYACIIELGHDGPHGWEGGERPDALVERIRRPLTLMVGVLNDEACADALVGLDHLVAQQRETLERVLDLAENLFQMVPRSVWRDHGGDDGQGHYEGDYRAGQISEELAKLRAALEHA